MYCCYGISASAVHDDENIPTDALALATRVSLNPRIDLEFNPVVVEKLVAS